MDNVMHMEIPRGGPPPALPLFARPWPPAQPKPQLQPQSGWPLQQVAKVLRLDSLKSQLQTSLTTRLPAWGAETATPTLEQAKVQVSSPVVLAKSVDVLRQLLGKATQGAVEAMGQAVQQAAQDAVNFLAGEEALANARQVSSAIANTNVRKAAAALDAEVDGQPKTNPMVEASMKKGVEAMLAESQTEGMATMSHWALTKAVEAALQSVVFPQMLQAVTSSYSEYLHGMCRDATVVPATPLQVRSATRAAAQEVSAEAMLKLPADLVPVVDLSAAASVSPLHAAMPAMPAATPLDASALQQLKKRVAPLAAPVPRYACSPRPDGQVRPAAARPPLRIDAVPDEALQEVLAHLDPAQLLQCSLVCRRWLRLCRGEDLWRRMRIRYDPAARAAFAVALRRAPLLAMVDCDAMTEAPESSPCPVSDHDLLRLLHSACRVEGLRLPVAPHGAPSSLVASVLDRHRDSLRQVRLTCAPGADARDLASLLAAVDHLPALRRLCLAGRFNVDFTFGPRQLGAPPRRIAELDLSAFSAPPHTLSSLLAAYAPSLRALALPPVANREQLSPLLRCTRLLELTAAADALAHWACLPPSVSKLTLTPPRRDGVDSACPSPLHKLVAAACNLGELVLDGVPVDSNVPMAVRAALAAVHSLTLRRVVLGNHVALLREMPALERLTLDDMDDLSADQLRELSRAPAAALRHVYILRSLRCSDEVCWKPFGRYLQTAWPQAQVHVGLCCNCASSD